MTNTEKDEIAPDELMETFRGRSLKSIIVFTIFVHAVLLLGSSVPYLMKVIGANTSDMTEEQRRKEAVLDATASLDVIAKEYGLNIEDITDQFAGGPRAPRAPETPGTATPKPPEGGVDPEDPKSAIEKEIDVKAEGPALPKIEDDDEDLFK